MRRTSIYHLFFTALLRSCFLAGGLDWFLWCVATSPAYYLFDIYFEDISSSTLLRLFASPPRVPLPRSVSPVSHPVSFTVSVGLLASFRRGDDARLCLTHACLVCIYVVGYLFPG